VRLAALLETAARADRQRPSRPSNPVALGGTDPAFRVRWLVANPSDGGGNVTTSCSSARSGLHANNLEQDTY